ncbi:hypothetical protein ACJA28_01850 [Mesomycoplasma moatsii]|uniref:hypothetical protein n=1 Tax=Mesomycoplasma moatsii TaxID=171287 RepID=UPI003872B19F
MKNVAYCRNYGWQSDGDFSHKLTKDNIVMMAYKYFPATGKMRLDIRLNVWNKNDQVVHAAQGIDQNGIVGTEKETDAPFGTWWIGGFRTDNVTTFVDQDRIWELDGIDQIPAGDAYNQQYWTTMHQAIVGQGVQKGYLKFPYWVNIDDFKGPNNDYGGLIKYNLVEVVDAANGIAKIKVTFRNNYWAAQNDGKVTELAADAGQKIITIKGFRLAKPISIDSSKFFDFSAQLLTSPLYLDPTQRLDEFVRWLNQTEDKILDYIVA